MSDWLPEPPEVEPRPQRAGPPPVRVRNVVATFVCVTLVGVCLTWAFLAMRAVMHVGGSCGSDGTTPLTTPCPDGAWLMALAIPVLVIAAMAGSGLASTIGAPNQVAILWAMLFGLLGWNFVEFGVTDGVSVSLLIGGMLFWAMALPAWFGMAKMFVTLVRTDPRQLGWWAAYAVLLLCGGFVGLSVWALVA